MFHVFLHTLSTRRHSFFQKPVPLWPSARSISHGSRMTRARTRRSGTHHIPGTERRIRETLLRKEGALNGRQRFRCTQPPPAPKSVRGLREDRPAFRQISPFCQPRLGRSRKPSKTQRVWYHLRPTRGVTSSFQPRGLPPSSTSDDPLIRDRGRSIRSCWCLLLGHERSIQKEIFEVNPWNRRPSTFSNFRL